MHENVHHQLERESSSRSRWRWRTLLWPQNKGHWLRAAFLSSLTWVVAIEYFFDYWFIPEWVSIIGAATLVALPVLTLFAFRVNRRLGMGFLICLLLMFAFIMSLPLA